MAELEHLKKKIEALEKQENARQENTQKEDTEQQSAESQTAKAKKEEANNVAKTDKANQGIEIGGAVRYQYTWSDYDEDNESRGGDVDFNLFRLDLDGQLGDFILSAQYRWYDYMDVVHHAWIGYELEENQMFKLGIQEVPFGNFPQSANSFFYSTAFFVGLQADFDTGLNWTFDNNDYRFDIGFFPNDELGGVDGWVDDRKDRYSFDVLGVRLPGESISAAPTAALGEHNTVNLRAAKKFTLDSFTTIEPGVSYQKGKLSQNGKWSDIEGLGHTNTHIGTHSSWAAHLALDWKKLNLRLQYAGYDYDIDNYDVQQLIVGSYNFYGSIPASADTWLINVAWEQPVNLGPINKIKFFNDYSQMINKSGNLEDTWMNSTGMIISAGPLYTYVEWFRAKNQPFIGGSLVGNSSEHNERVNVNLGFYF